MEPKAPSNRMVEGSGTAANSTAVMLGRKPPEKVGVIVEAVETI